MHILLIAGDRVHQDRSCPVEQFFTSEWFQWAIRYAELLDPDRLYFISAKHGLVAPGTILEPFTESFTGMKTPARREWSDQVASTLKQEIGGDYQQHQFTLLCRTRQAAALLQPLGIQPKDFHSDSFSPVTGDMLKQRVRAIEQGMPVPKMNAASYRALSGIVVSTGAKTPDEIPPAALHEATKQLHHYTSWQKYIGNGWKAVALPDSLDGEARDLLGWILKSGDRAILLRPNTEYHELRKELDRYAAYYKYAAIDKDEEGGYAHVEYIFVSKYRYADYHASGYSDGWECTGFETTDELIRHIRDIKWAYESAGHRQRRELTEDDWVRRIQSKPSRLKDCPVKMRSTAIIKEAWRTGWIEYIKNHPFTWNAIPAELQHDSVVLATRRSALIASIQHSPELWEQCPPELQNDPEIDNSRRAGWRALVEREPSQWDKCPPGLQQIPELLAARKSGWLHYSASRDSIAGIPEDLLADQEMRERLRKQWQRDQNLSATEWLKCPEFVFANDPSIRNRISAAITRALRRNPSFWLQLPPHWRQRADLQKEAAECWAQSLDHRGKEPPDDIRLQVKALINC